MAAPDSARRHSQRDARQSQGAGAGPSRSCALLAAWNQQSSFNNTLYPEQAPGQHEFRSIQLQNRTSLRFRALIWVKEKLRSLLQCPAMPDHVAHDPGLRCEELSPASAATAFPLLREAIPGLTLSSWLRFARRLSAPRRSLQAGIVVVRRAPRPMPCGLFIWRRDDDLEHGAVLVAEHLVAIDLLDPAPVMAALVRELEALAKRLGCGGIRTMMIQPDAPIAAQLLAAGHAKDGAAMWKPMAVLPDASEPPAPRPPASRPPVSRPPVPRTRRR